MSIFSKLMGGSNRKQVAIAAQQAQQVTDQQAVQQAQISSQQAQADKQLGRSQRAARGRRLLRYAKGAAGTTGM